MAKVLNTDQNCKQGLDVIMSKIHVYFCDLLEQALEKTFLW